jgi:hypothetical protein
MRPRDVIRVHADRVAALAIAIAGAVILIVGWVGASGTAFPAEQLPYILSGGIGGLFLLGIAVAVWVSADLRDEWRKLDSIDEALRTLAGTTLVTTPEREPVE